jgi:hypothetical protein
MLTYDIKKLGGHFLLIVRCIEVYNHTFLCFVRVFSSPRAISLPFGRPFLKGVPLSKMEGGGFPILEFPKGAPPSVWSFVRVWTFGLRRSHL